MEKQKPLVSVIVPVYNGSGTIQATLDSLFNQTYENIEIIVVDDGSTDASAEIIKKNKDQRLKYFYQKNSGRPASPRNLGIKKASGSFIAFCDQDDTWAAKKIEMQLEEYDKYKNKGEIGIIYSGAEIVSDAGNIIERNDIPYEGRLMTPEDSFNLLLYGDFITACSVVVPKDALEEVGLFDEDLIGNDDYDLWLRITKKYSTLGVPDYLCQWRKTTDNLSAQKSTIYLENEKIFKKLFAENTDNEAIKIGYGRNINRVMVSAVIDGDQKLAQEYAQKAGKYPVSLKGKVMAFLIRKKYSLAEKILGHYQEKGEVSL